MVNSQKHLNRILAESKSTTLSSHGLSFKWNHFQPGDGRRVWWTEMNQISYLSGCREDEYEFNLLVHDFDEEFNLLTVKVPIGFKGILIATSTWLIKPSQMTLIEEMSDHHDLWYGMVRPNFYTNGEYAKHSTLHKLAFQSGWVVFTY